MSLLFLWNLEDVPRPQDRPHREPVVVEERRQRHAVAAREVGRRLTRPYAAVPGAAAAARRAPCRRFGGPGGVTPGPECGLSSRSVATVVSARRATTSSPVASGTVISSNARGDSGSTSKP